MVGKWLARLKNVVFSFCSKFNTMATVKYQLLSKSENAPIYLRLSVKRDLTPRAKTGLHISPKNWSDSNFPKTNTATNKKLKSSLQKLETYISDEVNTAQTKGELTNTNWLKYKIDVFFKRVTENEQSDLLTDAIQSIIDEAPTRKNGKGGIGLSKTRVDSYISLKTIITEYQKHNSYKVKDINVKFARKSGLSKNVIWIDIFLVFMKEKSHLNAI
jgi:hypothetical protein